MFCNHHTYGKNDFCGGLIDYDEGFNHLVCEKCGKQYQAKMLKQESEDIIINKSKGDVLDMKIKVVRGKEVLAEVNNDAMDYIAKPRVKVPKGNSFIKVHIERPVINEQIKEQVEEALKTNEQHTKMEQTNNKIKRNLEIKAPKVSDTGKIKVVIETGDHTESVKSENPVAEQSIEVSVKIDESKQEETLVQEKEITQEQIKLDELEEKTAEDLANKLNKSFNSDKDEEENYQDLIAKYGIKEEDFEEDTTEEDVYEEDEEEYEDFQTHNKRVINDVESQY